MNNSFVEDVMKQGYAVVVSKDGMQASIYLSPPTDGTYTEEDIIRILRQNDVKQGIDYKMAGRIVQENLYNQLITIAQGKSVVQGKDGRFELYFRTELPSRPKVLEDGSVDYLEMDLFEHVKQGQLLVEYKSPTAGTIGFTVNGKLVMPRRGKEKPALRGNGFVISEDKSKYYSAVDGKVEIRQGYLVVSSLYIVHGDLTHKIGNVHFNGDVHVLGGVQSGMEIEAGGGIVIEGVVEGAKLTAGNDIILKRGTLAGGKGLIKAGGNIYGKFFESANVEVGGSIFCNYLLNSNCTAKKKIEVSGKKGIIVGGITRALLQITVFNLGNSKEILTTVEVGMNELIVTESRELEKKISKVTSELELFEKNLLPASSLYEKIVLAHRMKSDELKELLNQKEQILAVVLSASNPNIVVWSNLYPGALVQMDMEKLLVREHAIGVKFEKKDNHVAAFKMRKDG